jgi:hypothetical protein
MWRVLSLCRLLEVRLGKIQQQTAAEQLLLSYSARSLVPAARSVPLAGFDQRAAGCCVIEDE